MIRSEKLLLTCHAIALLILAALSLHRGAMPDWPSQYTPLLAVAVIIAAALVLLRRFHHAPRLALLLLVMLHFIALTILITLINVSLLPIAGLGVDRRIAELDSVLFGYRWQDYVAYFSQYPFAVALLRVAYISAFPLILLTVLALAQRGAARRLHAMMWTALLSAVLTLGIWAAMPSFGPAVLAGPDVPHVMGAKILVNWDVGQNLRELAQFGVKGNADKTLSGLIAFPSFHMVMALLAVWFSRGTWARAITVPMAILMLPAILLHGGHHVLDLLGGGLVFLLAALCAKAIVQRCAALGRGVNAGPETRPQNALAHRRQPG